MTPIQLYRHGDGIEDSYIFDVFVWYSMLLSLVGEYLSVTLLQLLDVFLSTWRLT